MGPGLPPGTAQGGSKPGLGEGLLHSSPPKMPGLSLLWQGAHWGQILLVDPSGERPTRSSPPTPGPWPCALSVEGHSWQGSGHGTWAESHSRVRDCACEQRRRNPSHGPPPQPAPGNRAIRRGGRGLTCSTSQTSSTLSAPVRNSTHSCRRQRQTVGAEQRNHRDSPSHTERCQEIPTALIHAVPV